MPQNIDDFHKEINAYQLTLALLWEGKTPIPYRFIPYRRNDTHLEEALIKAIKEIHSEQYPDAEKQDIEHLVSVYQPSELSELLKEIIFQGFHISIYPFDYFDACGGSWWENVPLKPRNESYFNNLKAKMRDQFGDPYETLVKHFLPYFLENKRV